MMTRDEFMEEAKGTIRQILLGKEHAVMDLVARAWKEGKRSAEVETLRSMIEEAFEKNEREEAPKVDSTMCYETIKGLQKLYERAEQNRAVLSPMRSKDG